MLNTPSGKCQLKVTSQPRWRCARHSSKHANDIFCRISLSFFQEEVWRNRPVENCRQETCSGKVVSKGRPSQKRLSFKFECFFFNLRYINSLATRRSMPPLRVTSLHNPAKTLLSSQVLLGWVASRNQAIPKMVVNSCLALGRILETGRRPMANSYIDSLTYD